jgi:hypothetical protein
MFKRTVQVSVVKNKKSEETQPESKSFIDHVDTITEVGAKVVYGAVVVLATYIVLDTVRQSTVKIVESKCN